jgi:hypothetical protein
MWKANSKIIITFTSTAFTFKKILRKSKAKFEIWKTKTKKTINLIMFDMIVYDCQQNVFFFEKDLWTTKCFPNWHMFAV